MSAVLASAGTTHPLNVAGLGIDARVAAEYGLRHVVAIAGVSAQDAHAVRAVLPVPARVLRAQLEAWPAEIAAFRIGALISGENVRAVAAYLEPLGAPVVVDPVLGASTGEALWANAAYLDDLRDRLLRLPVIVTPNLDETALLLHSKPLRDADAMAQAARDFVQRGARAALVTGGHLGGDPVDALATADETTLFSAPRLPGEMRGTGCVLAAALACELALGAQLVPAVERARAYVRDKIEAGTRFGPLQTAF